VRDPTRNPRLATSALRSPSARRNGIAIVSDREISPRWRGRAVTAITATARRCKGWRRGLCLEGGEPRPRKDPASPGEARARDGTDLAPPDVLHCCGLAWRLPVAHRE
jgi:hypothetical protein